MDQKAGPAIAAFLSTWLPEKPSLLSLASSFDECDPLCLDGPPEELANSFMELIRLGFTESMKKLFQGDHFYRSDTIKCARCRVSDGAALEPRERLAGRALRQVFPGGRGTGCRGMTKGEAIRQLAAIGIVLKPGPGEWRLHRGKTVKHFATAETLGEAVAVGQQAGSLPPSLRLWCRSTAAS